MSKNFRDQKEKPLDRAIWWIEWAIRNPKAEFMKSPTVKQGHIVGNFYDIIAVLTTVVLFILYIVFKLAVLSLRLVCGRKETEQKATKKKQK